MSVPTSPADRSSADYAEGSIPELLQRAVEEAARLLEADGAMIYLLDPATGEMGFAHDAGVTDLGARAWVRNLKLRSGEGMFGKAVAERRVLLTGDYPSDTSFVHAPGPDRVVREVTMRSLVVAPLVSGDTVYGGLGAFSHRLDAFAERDVALVRALADHAAASMANARLIADLATSETELERRADAERSLREIASRITALHAPNEVLQRTVDEAARLLGADGARIDLLDEASGALLWAYDAATGLRPGLGPIQGDGEAKAGEGISGRAVTEGRALFTGDYLVDERFEHAEAPDAYVREHGIRSVVAAPIAGERGALGALTVYSGDIDAFGHDEARLIEALASQAAIAITNADLIEELARSREEIAHRADAERSLRELAAQITAMHEPAEILERIVTDAARLVGAHRGQIDLFGQVIGPRAYSYPSTVAPDIADLRDASSAVRHREGGMAAKAVAAGRGVVTADYLADDSFPHFPEADEYVRSVGLRSVVAAPLVGEGGLVGVLQVGTDRPDAFGNADVALIEALANQAAIALTNARLIEELDRSRAELAHRAEAERSLREIAARITAIQDRPDLLQQVADEAARLLDAERVLIDLVEPIDDRLRWMHPSSELADATDPSLSPSGMSALPEGGIAALAVSQRRAIATGDYLADPAFEHLPAADQAIERLGLRSVIAAPMFGDEGLLGVLQVGGERVDAFGPDDAGVLEALATQAAIAITNARLVDALGSSKQELARNADAERSLREIAARITAIRDPADLLKHVVAEAARLLDARGSIIDLLDRRTDTIRWGYGSGVDEDLRERWLAQGIEDLASREAIQTRRAMVSNDYTNDPRFPAQKLHADFLREVAIVSLAVVPIIAEGGVLGTLSVFTERPGAFDEADAGFLQALADQVAIAATNANLIEQLERSESELAARVENERALREISGRIAAITEPGEVLERIVDDAKRLLDSDGAHITFLSDDGPYLVPEVLAGGMDPETREWVTGLQFPINAGINGLAAGLAQPVWTSDYRADPRIPRTKEDLEVADRLRLRAMAAAPLRATGGEVIGTLAVSYAEPREIPPDSIDMLQALADHASIAVTNTRLYERLRESEERYRFLVENAPDIVFSSDAAGVLTYVSETVERALGYRPDELIGRPFAEIIRYEDPSDAGRRFRLIAENPEREVVARFDLIHRDGHDVPFEVSSRGLVRDGAFAGVYGSARDIRERSRLERELRESEERYRFLVENSPDVVFSTDAEGRFAYLSETIEPMVGLRPDELVGQHFSIIVDPASMDIAGARWTALATNPSATQVARIELTHRDGHLVPVEVSAIGMSDAEGRFTGIHGATRDITERARLEAQLRRQAEELARRVEAQRTLAEMAAQIAALRDPAAVIQRSVDEAVRLLGADAALLNELDAESGVLQLAVAQAPTDRELDDVLVPLGQGVSGRAVAEARVIRTGDYTNDPAFAHAPELDGYIGRRGLASVMSAPLIASGQAFGALTVQAERTDAFDEEDAVLLGLLADQAAIAIANTQLYERLQSSELRYRHLVDNSPDMIWSCDPEGRFTLVSDSVERLFGYRSDEVIGQHWGLMTSPESMPIAEERWAAMVADPNVEQRMRIEIPHKDGRRVPVEISMIANVSEGRFDGAHGSVRDISDRERLEADLRRQAVELASSDERAHLARELHDSVTQALFSMTLLTRSIELLLVKDPSAVVGKLASLRELQRDALAEMRSLIFELRPGSLEQEGLVHALRTHTAGVQGRIGLPIVFEADLAERLPIEVEDVLYRVAQEALHNIVKHASARQVRLGLTQTNGSVRLQVTDDGKGFDPAAVPDGHLGLAGMRARAEKVGAAFEVRSRPGSGTSIEIVVPVGSAVDPAGTPAE